ncbi:MAG: hypothetical protein J5493_07870 [Lachnospiraceae bacterium]|nr:hypothetical protein [Lachnospiraceae bacterium]
MYVPIVNGRKINRAVCFLFLIMTAILLAAAGVFALLRKPEAASAFLMCALIMGGLALFYGLLWLVWSRKERKAERALKEAAAMREQEPDPGRSTWQEFVLPKEQLTETALKRYLNIARGLGVAVLVMFLLITGIQVFYGSIGSALQLVYVFVFCLLIALPGLLLQRGIYKKYERSVPERIMLFPGKLVVDEAVFASEEIRDIRVSPDRLFNPNSPALYRELQIRTARDSAVYRLDYRAAGNEQPRWEAYPAFIAALSAWGKENRVPVDVSYMD